MYDAYMCMYAYYYIPHKYYYIQTITYMCICTYIYVKIYSLQNTLQL